MEILPTYFEEKGFNYRQIRRKKTKAIYEQRHNDWPAHIKYFEVIRIQKRLAYTINDKEYPEKEIYPSATKWGIYGWTYTTYEEALLKYNKMKG